MPSFNFRKEAELYIVHNNQQYRIDISQIDFSQTFAQQNFSVKTLHNQAANFEGSVINTANPGDFSFTFPALVEGDFTIIETLLISVTDTLSTFDLYVKTKEAVFKLETCVITNGNFVIEKSRPLSITIQGEAVKVTRVGSASSYTIPGSVQSRSGTRTYNAVPRIEATINYSGSNNTLSDIVSVNLELQNEGRWNEYKTVHAALSVTNASNSMYPSEYSLQTRTLGGSISQYITEENTALLQQWDTDATITIKAGNGLSGSSFRGFSFGPATCSFTNRAAVADVFLQSIDWRMTQNPTNLASILKYDTD